MVLTVSVPPCLSFPIACGGAVIWPGSQPGRRGLNSCFVPAALVGRCSGKANIPRPGIYRLAAPSLRLPARGTGRGAALLPGERRGPGSPLLPISVLSPLSSGSLRGHRRGGRGRAGTRRGPRQEAAAMGGFPPPHPDSPWDALHPSAFTPMPLSQGSPGRADPQRMGGPPQARPSGVPAPLAVAPACFAGSGARSGCSWAGVRGRGGGARSIPHIFNGSAEPVGCCPGDSTALRPGSSAEAGMHLLNRFPPSHPSDGSVLGGGRAAHSLPPLTLRTLPSAPRFAPGAMLVARHRTRARSGWAGAAKPAREGWAELLLPGRGCCPSCRSHGSPSCPVPLRGLVKAVQGRGSFPSGTADGGSFAPD